MIGISTKKYIINVKRRSAIEDKEQKSIDEKEAVRLSTILENELISENNEILENRISENLIIEAENNKSNIGLIIGIVLIIIGGFGIIIYLKFKNTFTNGKRN